MFFSRAHLIAGLAVLCVSPASGQVSPTVIARTGTGTASIAVNTIATRPVVAESGVYAFAGVHDVDGLDSSLWYGTAGNAARILRNGEAAPGIGGGVTVSGLSTVGISESGTLVFRGTLSTGSTHRAVWTYTAANGFQLVARHGQTATGSASAWSALYFDQQPAIDGSNRAVFAGEAGSGNYGVWAGTGALVTAVALKGQQAPDLANGVVYNQFGQLTSGPRVNAGGEFVFRSTLSGTSLDTSNAIFAGPATAMRLIAQSGTQAPGTAAGTNYINLDTPKLADTGRVAFGSQLTGTGVTASNDWAYFVGRPGEPTRLVAREGDAAPVIGGGATFSKLTDFGVRLGGGGHVVFYGEVQGGAVTPSNDTAVWYGDDPDNLQLLVRKGDAVPGGTLTNLIPVTNSGPVVNGNGVVVFRGTATDGVGSFEGLWGGTPGNLHLLVRQGQVFDIDPSPEVTDNRTLAGFTYLPIYSTNSGQTALSDGNVFVFHGTYSGGQAILSVVVPVPEPTGLLAAGAAAAILARRRYFRR